MIQSFPRMEMAEPTRQDQPISDDTARRPVHMEKDKEQRTGQGMVYRQDITLHGLAKRRDRHAIPLVDHPLVPGELVKEEEMKRNFLQNRAVFVL